MATWGDIKTLVKSNLGKQSDSNVVTLLPIWADTFQKEVQRDRNYDFLKSVFERSVDETQQTYSLPSNFLEGLAIYLLKSNPDGFVELNRIVDLDVIRAYAPVITGTTAKAEPRDYTLDNGQFTLWPWPNTTYTLRTMCWADIDPPVAASADSYVNSWITKYPDLYEAGLTEKGFMYLQEFADAKEWRATKMRILSDLRAQWVKRVMSGKQVAIVPRNDAMGTNLNVRGTQWRDLR